MTDETDTADDSTVADDHPYRISGVPPVPFEDNRPPYDDASERGETVHAVLKLGGPKEDPTVDRVLYDAQAAHITLTGSKTTQIFPQSSSRRN